MKLCINTVLLESRQSGTLLLLPSHSLSKMVSFKLSLGLYKGYTMHFKGQIKASRNGPIHSGSFGIVVMMRKGICVNSQILERDYKKCMPASSLPGKEMTQMDAFF